MGHTAVSDIESSSVAKRARGNGYLFFIFHDFLVLNANNGETLL